LRIKEVRVAIVKRYCYLLGIGKIPLVKKDKNGK